MNSRKRKRTARAFAGVLALLFLLLLHMPLALAAASLSPAFGEEDALELQLDLALTHFAALDLDTGALLIANRADEPFAPTGGAVTMMTAYLAAQALAPDAMLPLDGGEERVSDLAAAMLLEGATDAADRLSDAAGLDAEAMNEAAQSLGMLATTYINCTGAPEAGASTTCIDLLRLGEALTLSEAFADVVACPVWETAGGASLQNRVELLDPESDLYDARVLAAFGAGQGEALFNTVILAQAGEQRLLLACAAEAEEAETYALLSGALDALESGYFRVDLTSEARAALDAVAAANDLTYALDEPLVVSARSGWTLQEGALRVETQNIRETAAAGETYADAVLLVNGREIARLPLLAVASPDAAAETTPTAEPQPDPTPEPDYASPSVAPEDLYQRTAYDRCGWALWALAGLVGAAAVLVVLGLIDRRLR